eukprot:1158635-Pelagomonas_calceolata.AAC.10
MKGGAIVHDYKSVPHAMGAGCGGSWTCKPIVGAWQDRWMDNSKRGRLVPTCLSSKKAFLIPVQHPHLKTRGLIYEHYLTCMLKYARSASTLLHSHVALMA